LCHPDKAPDHLKDTAHATFQSIAFAYAILSDSTRRKRYDTTGSTSESIIDSDGFSWSDFYSEQFQDVISVEAIEKFAKQYKGSDEEKDDLLISYQKHKGNMDKVYHEIMLSDPIEDDDRFRAIIDTAIASGDVQGYKAYVNETRASKDRRIKQANREGAEAMAYAEELGVKDKLFRKAANGKPKSNGEDALMALIQKRQVDRGSFLDNLEAKYAAKEKGKAKKGKKRASDEEEAADGEPSEEAFQATAARLKKHKADTGDTARTKRSKR
jgi:DnaJ family protein C protein 9